MESIKFVSMIANKLKIEFFIVGAMARDLLFSAIFGVKPIRATIDCDFAIRVKGWNEFEIFKNELLANNKFQRDERRLHRFTYENDYLIDIIPFGEIATEKAEIKWPPDNKIVMSVLGFKEAYKASVTVKLSEDPLCEVKVCTPAGLAMLKIISWSDAYPKRNQDAKDLHFIIKNYLDAGNSTRLYEENRDIIEEKDFDYDLSSARLLGRDIAKITDESSLKEILNVLENETNDFSDYNLARDIMTAIYDYDSNEFKELIKLLQSLKKGIVEFMTPTT
jgi:predicted nucleotidyltransferase